MVKCAEGQEVLKLLSSGYLACCADYLAGFLCGHENCVLLYLFILYTDTTNEITSASCLSWNQNLKNTNVEDKQQLVWRNDSFYFSLT